MANGYKVRIGEPTKSANGKRLMPFVMIFREEQEQESIHDLKPCPMGEDLKTKVIDTIDSLIPKGQNSLDLETAVMAYGITRAKEAVEKLFAESSTQTNDSNALNALDTISRQAAIDEVCKMMYECFGADEEELDAIEVTLHELPSAQPEPEEFEWCTGCKEYDQKAHCCHRWTKVIRNTVEEIKNSQPESERKKGMWTTEQVAEMLANLFGDECACNCNGIDEWLPSACKYADTQCPDPKEKHGCWMQFLIQGGGGTGE